MDYTLEFISTSDPKTNKRRNFEMREKAGNLLTKNGFSAGDIPKVKDIEETQEAFRRLGLKNTSLFGDHFVIAQDSGGKIIGAARFHCSSDILSQAFNTKRLDVMQKHLSKANLTQVFVEREKRDKGIGTQLVKEALEEAKRLGFTQMYGYAENDSSQLVNFYKNLGFAIESGNQPTSIFGDIPGTVLNPRTGGVFFQQSLEHENGQPAQKEEAIPQEEGAENTKVSEQPLVTNVENRKTESRPIPTECSREEGAVGKRGVLDWIRGLSIETRYRIGNIGLILVQALLFLVANFFAKFPGWWAERSALEAMGMSFFYVVPFAIFLSMYYASVSGQEKKPPRRVMGLVAVAIVAALPAGVEGFATPGVVNSLWWRGTALAIGTVCQGVAGYIAWKATDLIPTPSAEKNSNEDGEE